MTLTGKFGQTLAAPRTWDEIQKVPAPFTGALGTDPKQFGYWFNYFWSEAITTDELSAQDKIDLNTAFFTVLVKAASGVGKYTPKPTFHGLGWFDLKKVLSTLLRIGFERVKPKGAAGGGIQAVDARDIFLDKVEAVKHNRKTTNVPTARQIHLGFRADGRKYDELVRHGFAARARSKGQVVDGKEVYKDYGLDRPWHPLSDGDAAKCLFLRKGKNKDNCLHTVVSVAFKLAPVVDYPLLSDPTLFVLGCKDTARWDASDRLAAKAHKYKVDVVDDPTKPGVIDHTESDLRLYVMGMNKATAFSTSAWQGRMGVANPFPEAAVSEVQAKHIIAQVLIRRKHFFDGDALYLYDFDLKDITFLPDEPTLKVRFGDVFPTALRAQLMGMVRGGKTDLAGQMRRYNMKKAPTVVAPQGKQRCPTCGKMFTNMMMTRHGC